MTTTTAPPPKPKTVLDERVLDYLEALRTASFKLVGNAPTLDQIESLRTTPDMDKPAKYEAMIDDILSIYKARAPLMVPPVQGATAMKAPQA